MFPAGDWGCLLRMHGCAEACSWRHMPVVLHTLGAFTAVPGIDLARQMFPIYTDNHTNILAGPRADSHVGPGTLTCIKDSEGLQLMTF